MELEGRISIDSRTSKLATLISDHGGQFIGLQDGPRGVLVMFTDLLTHSTLALPQGDINPEALSRRLRKSRQSYAQSLLLARE